MPRGRDNSNAASSSKNDHICAPRLAGSQRPRAAYIFQTVASIHQTICVNARAETPFQRPSCVEMFDVLCECEAVCAHMQVRVCFSYAAARKTQQVVEGILKITFRDLDAVSGVVFCVCVECMVISGTNERTVVVVICRASIRCIFDGCCIFGPFEMFTGQV